MNVSLKEIVVRNSVLIPIIVRKLFLLNFIFVGKTFIVLVLNRFVLIKVFFLKKAQFLREYFERMILTISKKKMYVCVNIHANV